MPKNAPFLTISAKLSAVDRTGFRSVELGSKKFSDLKAAQDGEAVIWSEGARLTDPANFSDTAGKPMAQTLTLSIMFVYADHNPKEFAFTFHRDSDAFKGEKAVFLAAFAAAGFTKGRKG